MPDCPQCRTLKRRLPSIWALSSSMRGWPALDLNVRKIIGVRQPVPGLQTVADEECIGISNRAERSRFLRQCRQACENTPAIGRLVCGHETCEQTQALLDESLMRDFCGARQGGAGGAGGEGGAGAAGGAGGEGGVGGEGGIGAAGGEGGVGGEAALELLEAKAASAEKAVLELLEVKAASAEKAVLELLEVSGAGGEPVDDAGTEPINDGGVEPMADGGMTGSSLRPAMMVGGAVSGTGGVNAILMLLGVLMFGAGRRRL